MEKELKVPNKSLPLHNAFVFKDLKQLEKLFLDETHWR